MRIYSEARLSPAAQDEQPPELGSILIPRGSTPAGMVSNALLNRTGTYADLATGKIKPREQWSFDDRNNSMPPRRPALDAVVALVREPEAVGVPKVSHLFIDLEGNASSGGNPDDDARESLAAAYYLRAKLPKTILVSTYSRWGGSPERLGVFAESDDAVVYSLYVNNRALLASDPVSEWVRIVDESEDELEAVAPDKPRVAFLMLRRQIWWITDPQYASIAPLNETPVPVDFVKAMKSRLQKPPRRNGRSYRPWDLCVFGSSTPDLAAQADAILPAKA